MSPTNAPSLYGLPEHLVHKIVHDDRKIRKMGRKLRARAARPFIALDVLRQKWQLRNYVTAVERTTELRSFVGGRFAIFHYYETDGRVSASVQRILNALTDQKVNIVLVSNRLLSPGQVQTLSSYAAVLLERANIGQDFGGYKDAVHYMMTRFKAEGITPDRVIFLNDSVLFLAKGLESYVRGLLGTADIIHACDNWAVWHHLQSFAFSMSGPVFLNPAVQSFWTRFIPVSERNYAIRAGEMGLSDVLSAVASTSDVLYSAADAARGINQLDVDPAFWVPRVGRRLSSKLYDPAYAALDRDEKLVRIIDMVSRSTLTNNATYLGLKFGGLPFIKKNLVYMSVFYYHQVEQWIHEVLPHDEAEEYLHILRMMGDPNSARRARATVPATSAEALSAA